MKAALHAAGEKATMVALPSMVDYAKLSVSTEPHAGTTLFFNVCLKTPPSGKVLIAFRRGVARFSHLTPLAPSPLPSDAPSCPGIGGCSPRTRRTAPSARTSAFTCRPSRRAARSSRRAASRRRPRSTAARSCAPACSRTTGSAERRLRAAAETFRRSVDDRHAEPAAGGPSRALARARRLAASPSRGSPNRERVSMRLTSANICESPASRPSKPQQLPAGAKADREPGDIGRGRNKGRSAELRA